MWFIIVCLFLICLFSIANQPDVGDQGAPVVGLNTVAEDAVEVDTSAENTPEANTESIYQPDSLTVSAKKVVDNLNMSSQDD